MDKFCDSLLWLLKRGYDISIKANEVRSMGCKDLVVTCHMSFDKATTNYVEIGVVKVRNISDGYDITAVEYGTNPVEDIATKIVSLVDKLK